MRAFILRRVGLIRHAQGGVVADRPGPRRRHAAPAALPDPQRLPAPAARHRRSTRTPAASSSCFELTPEQLPVVISPGRPRAAQSVDGRARRRARPDRGDRPRRASTTSPWSAPGRPGWRPRSMPPRKGWTTIVIEGMAPGGQAGTSSKIENYLGFPTGISGQALAGRAQVQAQKFGARLAISRMVVGLDCERAAVPAELDDGQVVAARAIVIATGARYRKLDVAELRAVRGPGHPLRRDRDGGAALRRRGGGRRRRRQLGRPGGGVPVAHRRPRAHPGARRAASPRRCPTIWSSASRPRRGSPLHPRTEITALDGRRPAARRSPGPTARPARSETRADRQRLRDDRRRAQHRLARRLPGARRQGLRPHRAR